MGYNGDTIFTIVNLVVYGVQNPLVAMGVQYSLGGTLFTSDVCGIQYSLRYRMDSDNGSKHTSQSLSYSKTLYVPTLITRKLQVGYGRST